MLCIVTDLPHANFSISEIFHKYFSCIWCIHVKLYILFKHLLCAKISILDVWRTSKTVSNKFCFYPTCSISWSMWFFRKPISSLSEQFFHFYLFPFTFTISLPNSVFQYSVFSFKMSLCSLQYLKTCFFNNSKNVQKICTVIWLEEAYFRKKIN